MPVTGTYNTAEIVKGPIKMYVNVPLPADNAVLALTSGVPASGLVVGLTVGGAKVSFTYSETSEEADETTTPFNKIISAETLSLEAEIYQIEDMTRLAWLAPTGAYFINAGATEGLKFGGATTIPSGAKPSVLAVGPLTSDPTKYLAVQFFSAINTAGIAFDWTRKKSSSIPIKLEAQAVTTRTAGNQAGIIWKTLA
ncbi:MAG TPA: hypothetical protein PLD20_24385 [Blastocatellia bacterium]|nr:hypothetical protein [Blastocatellia bacterium]HMZ21094.1 hypothetical protein [Blastocatellia bacterium]HNG34066.1 hypothetical protein [Blastocatellia bacterium]